MSKLNIPYVQVNLHTYEQRKRIYVCMYSRTEHVCMRKETYVSLSIFIHVCVHMCVSMYAYICMIYECMYTHICMRVHSLTHIPAHTRTYI